MKGAGFWPNEDLEVTLHSDPIELGYPKADANGAYFFTARIPAGVTPGSHHIEVRGLESGAVVKAPITILANGSASTGVKDLANTGAGFTGTAVAIAGGLLLAGIIALAVLYIRRRPTGGTA